MNSVGGNLVPQRAHLSHVVDIHIIYSHLIPYEQTSILRADSSGAGASVSPLSGGDRPCIHVRTTIDVR